MKSKIPLILMEQMVMLLVFALAAALCLQAFVKSDQMSGRSHDRDRAVTLVQDMAETVRHCGGVEEAAKLLGADCSDGHFNLAYDENWNPGETEEVRYVLKVEEIRGGQYGLGMALVTMEPCAAPAEPLFQIAVAWQEDLKAEEAVQNGT